MVVYLVWEENNNQQRPERRAEQGRWKCNMGKEGNRRGDHKIFRVPFNRIYKTTLVLEITQVL
jgi:hypothetical protein